MTLLETPLGQKNLPAVRFAIVLVVTGQDTHTIGMIQLKAEGWEESWEMGGTKGLGVLSAEERPRWVWRGLALGPNGLGAEANHARFSKPISSSNFQLLSITHP